MNHLELLTGIQTCFDESVSWAKDWSVLDNQLKSAKFVHEIGNMLWIDKSLKLNVITAPEIPEKDKKTGNWKHKKGSGEWLLDVTITQNIDGFKKKIVWAVESESHCSKGAFHEDFAKLFHINSDNHLYLNGLKQKTNEGKDKYIGKRLKEVEEIIKDCDRTFWFAFWASPCKYKQFTSIWDHLNEEGEFNHLKDIRLFKFESGSYKEIEQLG